MGKIKSLLWVSDGHAAPGETPEEFERFSWLGHYVARHKPEIIIYGGDFWDNPSLNPHKGSTILAIPGKEDPRAAAEHDVIADWEVGKSAIRAMRNPWMMDNERHARAGHKERQYNPDEYYLLANHEGFSGRSNKKHPGLRSVTNMRHYYEFLGGEGIEVLPEHEPLILNGVIFNHQFTNDRGNAVQINNLLGHNLMSCVSGHSHIYGEREKVRGDGAVQRAIVAGCWKHERAMRNSDRAGLLMMHDLNNGEFHHQFVPQNVVARDYRRGTGRYAA